MNAIHTKDLRQILPNQMALKTQTFAHRIPGVIQVTAKVIAATILLVIGSASMTRSSAQTCGCELESCASGGCHRNSNHHRLKMSRGMQLWNNSRRSEPSCGCEPTCGLETPFNHEPSCGCEVHAQFHGEPNCGVEPNCGCEQNSCDVKTCHKFKRPNLLAKLHNHHNCLDCTAMHRCECGCHNKSRRKPRGPSLGERMLTSLDRMGDNFERAFRSNFDKGCCDCACDGGMIDCDGSMCGSSPMGHTHFSTAPFQTTGAPVPMHAHPHSDLNGQSMPVSPSADGSTTRTFSPPSPPAPDTIRQSFESGEDNSPIPEALDNPFQDDPVSLEEYDQMHAPSSNAAQPPRINRYRTQPVSGQPNRYFRAYDPQASIDRSHRQNVQAASAERLPTRDNVRVSFSDNEPGPVRRSLNGGLEIKDQPAGSGKVIRAGHRTSNSAATTTKPNNDFADPAPKPSSVMRQTSLPRKTAGAVKIKFHPSSPSSDSPAPINGAGIAPLPNSN